MQQDANNRIHHTPAEFEAMMTVPASLVHLGLFLLQVVIYGLPALISMPPIHYFQSFWAIALWIICIPVVYAFFFGLIAGLLSIPFQHGIIEGVFPRDVRFPIYALRRLYGICWTSVYYFKPVYSIILNVALFKAMTFRLFGYRGSLDFRIYPDAWIRDLPLLRFEAGAYVANRATVASNICMRDGNILVGPITLMKGAILGHLSILATGAKIGERTEVGADADIGLHAKIGNDATIGSASVIGHKARIGNNTHIGACSMIGIGAVIGDNLTLPINTSIPDGVEIYCQEDLIQYSAKAEFREQQVTTRRFNVGLSASVPE